MTATQPPLLTIPTDPEVSASATALRATAKAKNTRDAYASAWTTFTDYCTLHKRTALPAGPLTVSEYLTFLYRHRTPRLRPSSITVHRAAIAYYHHNAGRVDPCKNQIVIDTWTGILRAEDHPAEDAPPPKPVTVHVLQKIVEKVVRQIDADLHGQDIEASAKDHLAAARDRALILLTASTGYITANEAHSLIVGNWTLEDAGIRVQVRRSPDVPWRSAFIHRGRSGLDPVEAIARCVRELELHDGDPLFRPIDQNGLIAPMALSRRHMNDIVKRRAHAAGIEGQTLALLSMRSWRGGAIQQAAYKGVPTNVILEDAGMHAMSAPKINTQTSEVRRRRQNGQHAPDVVNIT